MTEEKKFIGDVKLSIMVSDINKMTMEMIDEGIDCCEKVINKRVDVLHWGTENFNLEIYDLYLLLTYSGRKVCTIRTDVFMQKLQSYKNGRESLSKDIDFLFGAYFGNEINFFSKEGVYNELVRGLLYDKYKSSPEGSGQKRLYDSEQLSFQDYLTKYYSSPKLNQWNQFYKNFVEPVFKMDAKSYKEHLKLLQVSFSFVPDHKRSLSNYSSLVGRGFFTVEMSKFLAVLLSDSNFQRGNSLFQYDTWLDSRNTLKAISEFNIKLSIKEVVLLSNGEGFLKEKLMELPLFKLL